MKKKPSKQAAVVSGPIKKKDPEAQLLTVEQWPLGRLIPYARNPRKNLGAVDKVAASLKEFGWKQPIVVDVHDVIVVGDTRLRAARKLGLKTAPVVVARDLTPAQCKAYRLADNRTNEEAEWDKALLNLELEDLRLEGYGLSVTGFDDQEMRSLEAAAGATWAGKTGDDDAPSLIEEIVSAPGDVWTLGRHRLICGDATDAGVLTKLMGEEKAELIVTDPPYNVSYVGKTKDALTLKNDSQGSAPFYRFLYDAFVNMFMAAAPGAGIYVFHADTEGMNFRKALVDAGWKLAQCCVWVKQTLVMSRQDYHWQHEPVLFGHVPFETEHDPILYGWKKGDSHRWYADRRQTTVWEFDRPTQSRVHPTMKPVALLCYVLENSSRAGDTVLDLFGGSGSLVIACEKLGRSARVAELEPAYCDVIVRRWQQFTGKQAKRQDGTAFAPRC